MSRLTAFFSSNKTKLLFGFYLVLSISLTLGYQTFNQVRLLHTSGGIGARIHETTSHWRDYFSLRSQNEVLRQENARLKAAEWNQPLKTQPYQGPPELLLVGNVPGRSGFSMADSIRQP
jgi:hypothetical protein